MLSKLLESVAEGAAELLWPTRCVGCNMPGELLCEECRASLPWIVQEWACPNCGAPYGWLTCTECDRSRTREAWPTNTTICSFPYEGAPAKMVTIFKDAHELRLAPLIAKAMARSLAEAEALGERRAVPFRLSEIDAICFVPATAKAYARRGFDHMELVSKELSRELGIPLKDVLVRDAALDQRTLDREGRAANLAGTVHALEGAWGMHYLLVDDVITTGSSIREATRALDEVGAASVSACSFARVWS